MRQNIANILHPGVSRKEFCNNKVFTLCLDLPPLPPEEFFLQTEIPIHHYISHIDVVMKLASEQAAVAFEKFDWKDGVNDEYPRLK